MIFRNPNGRGLHKFRLPIIGIKPGGTLRNAISPFTNQEGSILLTTVIILLLLTIIGVSGINTASTDLEITRNYRIYKENLMLADGAVNHAKSLIAYGEADNSDAWVNDILDLYNVNDKYLKDGNSWDTTNTPVLNEIEVDAVIADWGTINEIDPRQFPGEPDTQYVVYRNLNSTDGNAVVIVRSRKNGGNVTIEAGFNGN